jgi:hypothetical protein
MKPMTQPGNTSGLTAAYFLVNIMDALYCSDNRIQIPLVPLSGQHA